MIPRSMEKILDSFLIISFSFHFDKEIDHSNSYIISNFLRSRDTRRNNKVFRLMQKSLQFLTNQNKRFAITLINIK